MTLQEFFDLLAANPFWILAFFILVPFTAWLAGNLGKGEGHLTPWKYLYSTLVYLSCVPGIFAVTLSIYLFIFERRPILQTDIYTQILPVLSMVGTLLLIRRNVDLKDVPGFEKISGLILVITATLALMWFIDRTHIWVISFLPFWQAVLIFIGLLLTVKWGWGKIFSNAKA
ncbi:MAG: hypothetical protein EPO28_07890 [Saprospiraceae bacterium]|nr:MAG: hypothetical protein EPO28_07890 [Saprospiraceae bacterium]